MQFDTLKVNRRSLHFLNSLISLYYNETLNTVNRQKLEYLGHIMSNETLLKKCSKERFTARENPDDAEYYDWRT